MKNTCALFMALAPLGSALVIPNVDANLESTGENYQTWLDAIYPHDWIDDESSFVPSADHVDKDTFHILAEKSSTFLESILDDTIDRVTEHPHHPPPHHGPGHDHDHDKHPTDEYTIWQLLEKSDHGKTFTELASGFKSIVDVLNSTSKNYTLFIPSERSFEKVPEHHKKPKDEELEKFLRYHIADGNFDAATIWHHNTLPTVLKESFLGDEQQRLRVRAGLRGVSVNGYARVIMPNIRAKNGVIHAIDHILMPPAMVGKGLSLFPSVFSTLLHAYDKTDFVSYIHSVPMEGSTVFAPSNHAFSKLGFRTNMFLFETERGQKILKAILKYGIVANTTLYSDAAYGKLSNDVDEDVNAKMGHSVHYELKTLYESKGLGVDIWRWGGFTSMKVNGYNSVAFADGIAKNGVVHVVDSVPMPPCPQGGGQFNNDGEMSIAELEERFQSLIEEDVKKVPERENQFVLFDL